jgi:hypothetical protein
MLWTIYSEGRLPNHREYASFPSSEANLGVSLSFSEELEMLT